MAPDSVSSRPLAAKIGADKVDRVVLVHAPPEFEIPGIELALVERTETPTKLVQEQLVLAFARSADQVAPLLETLAPVIFPTGAIWAAWPRRAAGHQSDITDQIVRSAAINLGLVDVKVAALGEHWSGLRLVWRVELRDANAAAGARSPKITSRRGRP